MNTICQTHIACFHGNGVDDRSVGKGDGVAERDDIVVYSDTMRIPSSGVETNSKRVSVFEPFNECRYLRFTRNGI